MVKKSYSPKTYSEAANKKEKISKKSSIMFGNESKKKSKLNPKKPLVLKVVKNPY